VADFASTKIPRPCATATMSTNPEQPVTITTYYTEPACPMIVSVPAHFSLDETRKAIHSAVSKYPTTQGTPALELPSPDLSSIIIASGEFILVSHTLPLTTNASKGFEPDDANTPVGQFTSEDEFVIHVIVPPSDAGNPYSLQELAEVKEQFSETKKGTDKVNFKSQDSELG